MPRKYIRKTYRGQWSTEALKAALAAIKCGTNLRKAARKFGIPATTLHRHHKGKTPCSQSKIIIVIKTWSVITSCRYRCMQGFRAPNRPHLWRGAGNCCNLPGNAGIRLWFYSSNGS